MLPDIIEKHDLEPDEVANLISPREEKEAIMSLDHFNGEASQGFFNPRMYLSQIIDGEIDADQIDYLMRDSHYTGIAHGTIDIDRLIQTMEVYNNDLVINKRGLSAVEGMLVSRSLMYSSIYFHKTVRIAELMLARAVEHAEEKEEMPNLSQMVDYDLLNFLDDLGGFPHEVVRKLKYRRLYKRIYSISLKELNETQRSALAELGDWEKLRSKEEELCEKFSVPPGHLFIDIPRAELQLSEPRLKRTQVKIRDKGLKPLSSYSPLARALQLRPIPDWELMVAVDPEYHEGISDSALVRLLFD
jgi:HD superfamily phosphohydrolase